MRPQAFTEKRHHLVAEKKVAHIQYEVLHRKGGWCISCGETLGPPYNRKSEALRDTAFIADLLRKAGEQVEVSVELFDGRLVPVPASDAKRVR